MLRSNLPAIKKWFHAHPVLKRCLYGVMGCAVTIFFMDRMFPLNTHAHMGANRFVTVVTDQTGVPLRVFADKKGIWRYPIQKRDVSEKYIEALIEYEDRFFYQHPGVNPFALVRALFLNAQSNRVISGGSTLTMQVARLLGTESDTLLGKLKQILRALQLEGHLTKDEILTLYLNLAPFGGPIEGVAAAGYAYLGKPVSELTHADAALLAVLPQAPSRYRPDRHPERAKQARDKVLFRLRDRSVWSEEVIKDALMEPVVPWFRPQPLHAPLLARRLKKAYPGQHLIRTFIDSNLQRTLEVQVRDYSHRLSKGTSVAVMVMENKGLKVKAYVGSSDFLDSQRFGHVDMIASMRSPGSTLKPFLYGVGIEDGIIHSKSLLSDAPNTFGDYHPLNFSKGFMGPVTVTQALQRSLNVPAIQVMEHLGPNRFISALKQAGLRYHLPQHARPNLSLALGGFGVTMESLMGVYRSLSHGGVAGKPRFSTMDPVIERRLFSKGTAWIIRQILEENKRGDRPGASLLAYSGSLAWKTGTSYGFRDSWAFGITSKFAIGVWVGRPDGSPSPGYHGAETAAPLLFRIAHLLPQHLSQPEKPKEVTLENICWPLGTKASYQAPSFCHERHEAFVLNDQIPPTFKDPDEKWQSNPLTLFINPETKKVVDVRCDTQNREKISIALWPKRLENFIPRQFSRNNQIPDYDPTCQKRPILPIQSLKIYGLNQNATLRTPSTNSFPTITLSAMGGYGKRYWFINGKPLTPKGSLNTLNYHFQSYGRYQISVTDEQGNSDVITIQIAS